MRGFCYPATRWEIRTNSVTLDIDGRGKLLETNPRRLVAIFSNLSPGAVGVINRSSPELFAPVPFNITVESFERLSAFDYGDIVGDAWFGVGSFSDVINATEILPTPSSPAIELGQPGYSVPTEIRMPTQFQNVDTTTLDGRNTQRIALILSFGSGTYSAGFQLPISFATEVFRTPGNRTVTLLLNDFGPIIWEAWWARDISGSGSPPTFWEVVWIPSDKCEELGV